MKKTFVLTVSKTFLKDHPRYGKKTLFKKKITDGKKIHSIRSNYKYWKKIITQVNNKEAILSLREWTGKPYKSKQKEIKQYKKLGIQKITKLSNYIEIDKIPQTSEILNKLSKNDGLSQEDFLNWFPVKVPNGCIIHFTNFKY